MFGFAECQNHRPTEKSDYQGRKRYKAKWRDMESDLQDLCGLGGEQ